MNDVTDVLYPSLGNSSGLENVIKNICINNTPNEKKYIYIYIN